MSEFWAGVAALFSLGGAKQMVMPKPVFSLFDFSFIDTWGAHKIFGEAAAGDAIDQEIYKVAKGQIMLLQNANVKTEKTTGTAFTLLVRRRIGTKTVLDDTLIAETSSDDVTFSWPSSKAPSNYVTLGWHICFLHEGDSIHLTHALTALEAILDTVTFSAIIYRDPRYEK